MFLYLYRFQCSSFLPEVRCSILGSLSFSLKNFLWRFLKCRFAGKYFS